MLRQWKTNNARLELFFPFCKGKYPKGDGLNLKPREYAPMENSEPLRFARPLYKRGQYKHRQKFIYKKNVLSITEMQEKNKQCLPKIILPFL
jgi:hypothetical protein